MKQSVNNVKHPTFPATSRVLSLVLALFLCLNMLVFAEHETSETPIVPGAAAKEVFLNIDSQTLAQYGVSAEAFEQLLRDYLLSKSYTDPNTQTVYKLDTASLNISSNIVKINTTDLSKWYVYDHYDTSSTGQGAQLYERPYSASSSALAAAYPPASAIPSPLPYFSGTTGLGMRPYQSFAENQTAKFQGTSTSLASDQLRLTTIKSLLEGKEMDGSNAFTYMSGTTDNSSYNVRKLREHIYSYLDAEGKANMTFMGYGGGTGNNNYSTSNANNDMNDFLFYPATTEKTKTIEFDIDSSKVRTHSMSGAGFLLNCGIDQSTGKIKGYVLYINFTPSDGGKIQPNCANFSLLQLKDITAKDLSNGKSTSTTTQGKLIKDTSFASSVAVALNSDGTAVGTENWGKDGATSPLIACNSADYFKDPGQAFIYDKMHISIMFDNTNLRVFTNPITVSNGKEVNGATKEVLWKDHTKTDLQTGKIVNDPTKPLMTKLTNATGDNLTLADGTKTGYYGFGPIVDYTRHACGRTSAYTFSNLNMTFESDPFASLKAHQYDTATTNERFFVNLVNTPTYSPPDGTPYTQLTQTEKDYLDAMTNLRKDEIYYVTGVGNDVLNDGNIDNHTTGNPFTGTNLDNGYTYPGDPSKVTMDDKLNDIIQKIGDYIFEGHVWNNKYSPLPIPVPVAGLDIVGYDTKSKESAETHGRPVTFAGIQRVEQQMLDKNPVEVFINDKSDLYRENGDSDVLDKLVIDWIFPGETGANITGRKVVTLDATAGTITETWTYYKNGAVVAAPAGAPTSKVTTYDKTNLAATFDASLYQNTIYPDLEKLIDRNQFLFEIGITLDPNIPQNDRIQTIANKWPVGSYAINITAYSGAAVSSKAERSFTIIQDTVPPTVDLSRAEDKAKIDDTTSKAKINDITWNGIFRGNHVDGLYLTDLEPGWGVVAYQVEFTNTPDDIVGAGNVSKLFWAQNPSKELGNRYYEYTTETGWVYKTEDNISTADLTTAGDKKYMVVRVWDWVGNFADYVLEIAPYTVTYANNPGGTQLTANALTALNNGGVKTDKGATYDGSWYQWNQQVTPQSLTFVGGKNNAYRFIGWSTVPNATEIDVDIRISGNTTLYPVFEYTGLVIQPNITDNHIPGVRPSGDILVNLDPYYADSKKNPSTDGKPITNPEIDYIIVKITDDNKDKLIGNNTPPTEVEKRIDGSVTTHKTGNTGDPFDIPVIQTTGKNRTPDGDYVVLVKIIDDKGNETYTSSDIIRWQYTAKGLFVPTALKYTDAATSSNVFTFDLREVTPNATWSLWTDSAKNTAAADGTTHTVSFYNILYDQTQLGLHTYEISEVNNGGWTLATDNNLRFTVNVEDNDDGTLKITPVYNNKPYAAGNLPSFTNHRIVNAPHVDAIVRTGGHKPLVANDWTLQLMPDPSKSQPILDNFPFPIIAKNKADGTVLFGADENGERTAFYGLPSGKYYLEMSQIGEDKNGWTLDHKTVKVIVTVQNDPGSSVGVTIEYEGISDPTLLPIFTNVYNASGNNEVAFTKKTIGKSLTDDASTPTFYFIMNERDYPVFYAKTVKDGSNEQQVKFSISGNRWMTRNGQEFDTAGRYFYTLRELLPAELNALPAATKTELGITAPIETENWIYDKSVYTVMIDVVDNGDGTMTITDAYYRGEVADETRRISPQDVVFTNEYTANAVATIDAAKQTIGKPAADKQFAFTVKDSQGKVLLSTTNIEAAPNIVANLHDALKLDYTLNDVGKTFTYFITETQTNQAGWTLDSTVYRAEVSVVHQSSGKLGASLVYYDDATNKKLLSLPVFVNTYQATGAVTLTPEVVAHNKNMKSGQFEIKLTDTDGNTIAHTNKTAGDKSTTVPFTLDYTQNDIGKTFTYLMEETPNGDGGWVNGGDFYTVTVTVEDNGDGTLKTTVTLVDVDGNNVTVPVFGNTYTATGEVAVDPKINTVNKAMEKGQFVLTLADKINNTSANAANVDCGDISKVSSDLDCQEDAMFGFHLHYTEADIGKTYVYTIKQTANTANDTNWTDDAHEVTLTVTIADNDDGTLDIQTQLAGSLTFVNTYEAFAGVTLEAFKDTTGKDMTERQFAFMLEGEGISHHAYNLDAGTHSEINPFTIAYTQEDIGKTYTYTWRELAAQESGWTGDTTVYTATVKVLPGSAHHAETTVEYSDGQTTSAAPPVFVNSYQKGTASGNLEAAIKTVGKAMTTGQFDVLWVDADQSADSGIKQSNTAGGMHSTVSGLTLGFTSDDIGETRRFILEQTTKDGDGWTIDKTRYGATIVAIERDRTLETVVKYFVVDENNNWIPLTGTPEFCNVFKSAPAEGETITIQVDNHTNKTPSYTPGVVFELRDKDDHVVTAEPDKDGNLVNIPLPPFSDPGDYDFTVTQKTPNGFGWNNDDSIIKITVTVEDDDGDFLVVTNITYEKDDGTKIIYNKQKNTYTTITPDGKTSVSNQPPAVENVYEAPKYEYREGTFTLVVDGKDKTGKPKELTDDQFRFELTNGSVRREVPVTIVIDDGNPHLLYLDETDPLHPIQLYQGDDGNLYYLENNNPYEKSPDNATQQFETKIFVAPPCELHNKTNPDDHTQTNIGIPIPNEPGEYVYTLRQTPTEQDDSDGGTWDIDTGTTYFVHIIVENDGSYVVHITGVDGKDVTEQPVFKNDYTVGDDPSPSPSATVAPSATVEPSPSPSPSATVAPSATVDPSPSPSPSATVAPSATVEPSPSPSPSATVAPSATVEPSASAAPSASIEPSATVEPSPSVAPSASVEPGSTAEPSPSVAPSVSAEPSATVAPTPTIAPSVAAVPTPTVVPTPRVTAKPKVTPKPKATAKPTSKPKTTPTPAPKPVPQPDPTSDPTAVDAQEPPVDDLSNGGSKDSNGSSGSSENSENNSNVPQNPYTGDDSDLFKAILAAFASVFCLVFFRRTRKRREEQS